MSVSRDSLTIKIFADGADEEALLRLAQLPFIKGFTTNPTLMRKAGVRHYEAFAKRLLEHVKDRPISFEVFSDEFDEMQVQASKIASWGENVYVKIPVTNTRSESAAPLIRRLSDSGVKVNVTAVLTLDQVTNVTRSLSGGAPAVVSIFAGRIADTGLDPIPTMKTALELLNPHSNIELLWASPREILNVVQADAIGCHIITVTGDLLDKLAGLGKDLVNISLDTVKMFHRDAAAAGYSL